MRLRDKLELRLLVNLIVNVIERLAKIILAFVPKPKTPPTDLVKPRTRPLKKVVDAVDKIIPLPWRKNHE